jgi:hypothetical protein
MFHVEAVVVAAEAEAALSLLPSTPSSTGTLAFEQPSSAHL